ncbi:MULTISPECIES: FKBP-type peptidyl-prolyl cis-trans isomerase [Saliphagus]|uniref:Peptidyl-prolyl cis-trans isomerase n=1 Tax=Saliphagus infecundisoli TaxID=1849069 RepID=A0ABD5QCE6_9EURY|nr:MULTISPECIES: peptidylprolyl isomerase [Saliphagus]
MSVEPGDRVLLEYVGRLEDGTVFATSDPPGTESGGPEPTGDDDESEPLAFTVGRNEVIEGLDEAVVGMDVGETATVTVPPEDGYGEYDPDRVREYDVGEFEAMVGRPPEIGLHVEARNDLHGDVTAVAGDTVEVDFNHELAGKTLVLDVRVRDVA